MLLYAFLVVYSRKSVADVNQWVSEVRRQHATYESQGAAGLPSEWRPVGAKLPKIYEPLARILTGLTTWKEPMLGAVGGAMASWEGAGQQVGLTASKLHTYKSRIPPIAKKGSPRWKTPQALFAVADLIYSKRKEMQELLAIDEPPPQPTLMEALVINKVLEADVGAMEQRERLAVDAKRQSTKRLKTLRADRKKERAAAKDTAKQAATAAKKKLKETIDGHKAAAKAARAKRIADVRADLKPASVAAARGQVQAELSRAHTWRNKANKRARDAMDALGEMQEKHTKNEKLSATRLERAQTAEESLKAASARNDELMEHYGAALDAKRRHGKVADAVRQMPTWRPVVGKGSGRGRPKMEWGTRVIIYTMLALMCPVSSVGAIIVAIVKRTASWLDPVGPTATTVRECRFELRIVEEALAGRRVGAAYRVRQLGFDETTKFQDPSMVTSVLIEPTEGAKPEVVILRAAYATGGGTSELLARAVEEKCFARLRNYMEGWRATCEELYPGYKWTGPNAEDCGLHRLGGGGSFISDTCSGAQKTTRLLIGEVARQVEVKNPNWLELSAAEQESLVRGHTQHCFNHIRNIFLAPMSASQSAHVREALQEQLERFSSWERMDTQFDNLLRAVYKVIPSDLIPSDPIPSHPIPSHPIPYQPIPTYPLTTAQEFHHGGRYYKGKGKEFLEWLRDTHPDCFVMHLERAEGGRQVPIRCNQR